MEGWGVLDVATALGTPLTYAQSFLGTPYVWGGESPTGFDCSGLVQYVYRAFGISLPRTSEAQIQVGSPVTIGPADNPLVNALPGDLIFFNNASHEGIVYDPSANTMIDAPHTGAFVRYDSVKGFGSITGIRRVSDLPMTGGPIPTVPVSGTSATNLAADSSSTCVISLPVIGCVFTKGNLRAIGGGAIMVGGVLVAGLGVWLMMGKPGLKEAKTALKVGALVA